MGGFRDQGVEMGRILCSAVRTISNEALDVIDHVLFTKRIKLRYSASM